MQGNSSEPLRQSSGGKVAGAPTSRKRVFRAPILRGPQRTDSRRRSESGSGSRADDMDFRGWRRRIREYGEITNIGPIIRRYFVIGAFDGSLTVLGIIIGASAVGATEAHKALILSASSERLWPSR